MVDCETEFLTSVTPASKMVTPASFSSAAFWLTDYRSVEQKCQSWNMYIIGEE